MRIRNVVAALGLSVAASTALADLIYLGPVSLFGQGLGAVTTLITVQERGENGNDIESGCVSYTGTTTSFACVAGSSVIGGDNIAINNTHQLSTIAGLTAAGDLRFIVNVSEAGGADTVTLQYLYMAFFDPTGVLIGPIHSYTGIPLPFSGTGVGTAGELFGLNATEAGAANLQCPILANCWVGGGVQFLLGTAHGGLETVSLSFQTQQVPAPGSLALLGLGALALFGATRRRRR